MNSSNDSTHHGDTAPTRASTNAEADIHSRPKPPNISNSHTGPASPYEPHRQPHN